MLAEADAAVADAKDHFIANQGPLQPGGPFCVRDHISCGGVISRKVPARSAAKLNRPPSHLPSADGAEDLVGDGCGEAGVVVGGDAVAEDNDFVADADAGDGGDIDHGQVHRDAADDWSASCRLRLCVRRMCL